MIQKTRPRSDGQIGFSLLEMIVVVAVVSAAMTLLVPPVSRFLTAELREKTLREMEELAWAVSAYFDDVGSLPQALNDLREQPGHVTIWQGPYVRSDFADAVDHNDDFRFDIWLNPYEFSVQGSFCTVRSFGPNQVDELGGGDDLEIVISLGPGLRRTTLSELAEINRAIDAYNRQWFPSDPLTGDYPSVLAKLQNQGFLPADAETTTRLLHDGWSNSYLLVGDPVLHVESAGAP